MSSPAPTPSPSTVQEQCEIIWGPGFLFSLRYSRDFSKGRDNPNAPWHFFVNAYDRDSFMGMDCFVEGSRTVFPAGYPTMEAAHEAGRLWLSERVGRISDGSEIAPYKMRDERDLEGCGEEDDCENDEEVKEKQSDAARENEVLDRLVEQPDAVADEDMYMVLF